MMMNVHQKISDTVEKETAKSLIQLLYQDQSSRTKRKRDSTEHSPNKDVSSSNNGPNRRRLFSSSILSCSSPSNDYPYIFIHQFKTKSIYFKSYVRTYFHPKAHFSLFSHMNPGVNCGSEYTPEHYANMVEAALAVQGEADLKNVRVEELPCQNCRSVSFRIDWCSVWTCAQFLKFQELYRHRPVQSFLDILDKSVLSKTEMEQIRKFEISEDSKEQNFLIKEVSHAQIFISNENQRIIACKIYRELKSIGLYNGKEDKISTA